MSDDKYVPEEWRQPYNPPPETLEERAEWLWDYPIASLAVSATRYDVRVRETGETLVSGVDLDTALKEIERRDAEAGAKIHVAQEVMMTDEGSIG